MSSRPGPFDAEILAEVESNGLPFAKLLELTAEHGYPGGVSWDCLFTALAHLEERVHEALGAVGSPIQRHLDAGQGGTT